MTEAERQSVAALLGDRVDRLVVAWLSLCGDGGLDRDDARTVMRAVLGALVTPIDLGPLVETVIGSGTPLDQCVHRLGLLRHVLYAEVRATVAPGAAGDIAHIVDSAIDDILEATVVRMAADLAEAALVDPLTGMPNRRALEQNIARDLANADRSGQELIVVMVDLDGLKQRNDSDGHAAGDAALCALCGALQAGLRAGDGAYRLGGDEFVLVLLGAAVGDADLVIARVRGLGPPPFSWGAASFPREGRDAAALLALADKRLYAGRRQRRYGGGGTPAAAAPGAAAAAGAAGPALRRRRSRTRGRRRWREVRMAALCIRLASFAVPATALAVLVTAERPSRRSPPTAAAPAPARPGRSPRTGTGEGVRAGGPGAASPAPSIPAVAHPVRPLRLPAPQPAVPPALAAAHRSGSPAVAVPLPVTGPPPVPIPRRPTPTPLPPSPSPSPPPSAPHSDRRDEDRDERPDEDRPNVPPGPPRRAPYRQVERGP